MIPMPSPLNVHWGLDPQVVFLNHGSFGATPKKVLGVQSAWRERMEREPVRFMVHELRPALDEARRAIGAFVGCAWDDLAPVQNATQGVMTVLANLDLRPGDEILSNTTEYQACRNACRFVARRAGATVRELTLPFPISGPEEVVEAYERGATPGKTRLALVSHVTSSTGLVLPVERIARALERKGVPVLVDGAHAPGMIEGLEIEGIGASYYTANCHKWICSPKGSALLWVRRDRQAAFRPLAMSNNAEMPIAGRSQFLTEFDYVGTADPSAFLSVPSAIEFMGSLLPGGWAEVMRRNREMALCGREIVCRALGIGAPAPESMLGSIVTLILPPETEAARARMAARPRVYPDPLQDALIENWKIQVPVWSLEGRDDRFVRHSAQVYNSVEQYEYLARALRAELE